MAARTRKAAEDAISVVPADEAGWDDLQAVFGPRGYAARCQWIRHGQWRSVSAAERTARLREQIGCGRRKGRGTRGLVSYLDGAPVGWCAVEPRTAYPRLLDSPVPWAGRDEDPGDDGVWAVTCFVVRAGFRRRGISYALARAAVDYAKARGARALEGYAMITKPGQEVAWGELYVGSRSIFAAAGLAEVSRPTPRRVVMRIE